MLLERLLGDLDVVDVRGDVHRDVVRVSRDTRDVDAGTLFVAIRGAKVDGHDLVGTLGDAAGVIVERDVDAPGGMGVVRVRDTRVALAQAAAALNRHPSRAMRVVGITGTKGKTTTAALVEGALRYAGRIAGRIGTTGAFLDGRPIPSELTTPEAPEVQGLLARMRDAGATDAVMEVSSIGLVQRRVDAIGFHFAIFTNLGHDHLDFHGTIDEYRRAKARLFEELLRPAGGLPRAALWAEDPATPAMGAPADRWLYGFGDGCDLRIGDLRMDGGGMRFRLHAPMGATEVRSPLIGRYNALNLTAAIAAALACGIDLDTAAGGVGTVDGVPGRMEVVPNDRGMLVVVDYAHTEESLEAVLGALREVTAGRLWCVFGAGGDRDPGKRPRMGAVVSRLADRAVVTSDNPRSEDPRRIVDAILQGVDSPAHVDVDRAAAIRWTLGQAAPGDVVLIAGKGHETYQEIGGIKHPFDDREVARAALVSGRRG